MSRLATLAAAVAISLVSSAHGVTLSWDHDGYDELGDTESIWQYKVHFGVQSGQYDETAVTNGDFRSYSFPGDALAPNTTYYFVVSAIDNAGNESALSSEIAFLTADTNGNGGGVVDGGGNGGPGVSSGCGRMNQPAGLLFLVLLTLVLDWATIGLSRKSRTPSEIE